MKLILVLALMGLSACGYSSRDSELIGQVKKVVNITPIFCSNRTDVDVSLGVMRNGVGSMSHEDVGATVARAELVPILKSAAETGAIVKLTYDHARINFCWEEREITKVELVK